MKIIRISKCGECPWISWDRGAAFCDIGPNISDTTIVNPDCSLESGECEWIEEKGGRIPTCRNGVSFGIGYDFPFCPCCGGKIKIKEAKDANL